MNYPGICAYCHSLTRADKLRFGYCPECYDELHVTHRPDPWIHNAPEPEWLRRARETGFQPKDFTGTEPL